MRKRSIIVFSIAVFFLVAFFCLFILKQIVYHAQTFYKSTSEYVVQSNALFLEARISESLADLDRISQGLDFKSGDIRQINERLSKLDEASAPFVKGLYYSDSSGIVYAKDGSAFDTKNDPFLFKAHSGMIKSGVSDVASGLLSKGSHFFVVKSLLDNNNIPSGILFYVIDTGALVNPIFNMPFVKSASSFLMTLDGNFILEPRVDSVIKKYKEENPSVAAKDRESLFLFSEALKANSSGSVILNSFSMGTEFVSFARIKNSNWIVGLVETESDFYKDFMGVRVKIIALFAAFAIFVILLFALITLSGSRGMSSHRLTLQQEADFDELTGLWTESYFEEKCERLLKENPNKNYMLFGIDIRGFRIVQQTEGVSVANEQLVMLAKRLGQIAMQQGGIAARGAIDHLYMMYPIKDRESALKEFDAFLYNGNYFAGRAGERIPTKTGIVFAGKDYEKDSVQNLIGKTSYAKHIIQDNLLKNYSVYDQNMEARIIKDKKIERYIPIAFSHKEFYVVYQPKVDLTNGKVIGAEALVRWNSPELGECMPDEFITLFERNGYINRLDFYVYQKVFEFLDERIKAGLPNVPISVNMSRFHLGDEFFVKKFCELFKNYNIPPQLIEVEIVERSVGDGDNRLIEVTKQLHENKFRVAIDDFGNGESSLNIISEIPADVLKLDQKFMRVDKNGKVPSKDEYKIVAKIVEMAKSLGKETICEGVETEQQISFLRSVDVNYVQGFYYSKPLKESDFVRYLESHS
ncbi:MAG: EAL domain-containing protein [Treponema sp.]|nr:EAL domain-containing protein [Treponema sp.]